MISKAFDFLITVAVNGFIALFASFFIYFILAIAFGFAMIPVSIIAGDGMANSANNLASSETLFRILYAIVFFSFLLDDLGVPNFKTAFKKWRDKRKK